MLPVIAATLTLVGALGLVISAATTQGSIGSDHRTRLQTVEFSGLFLRH
jgi:hypothetical protein